ncbi:hypothetical protein [Luteipulveratus halotolerans]|uniref:Pilus assembly protein TadE n=1 Tax=Luteipulveratus halotolerans TaxID=1631356 RepID=A0A0L6CEG8_9MICO|nr:hypothetical protein [Luteipulveratus halotolerans]KNX35903.1 hypothetical protein VV01_21835 [Luteipulveratus halotolerans]
MNIRAHWCDDRGNQAPEYAIAMSILVVLLSLSVGAYRYGQATSSVTAAAGAAARAASIEREPGRARAAAEAAAAETMASKGMKCQPAVTVDTGGFSAQVGQPASVGVRVSCNVDLSDLSVPGLPGSRNLTAQATSALDTYRERR